MGCHSILRSTLCFSLVTPSFPATSLQFLTTITGSTAERIRGSKATRAWLSWSSDYVMLILCSIKRWQYTHKIGGSDALPGLRLVQV